MINFLENFPIIFPYYGDEAPSSYVPIKETTLLSKEEFEKLKDREYWEENLTIS